MLPARLCCLFASGWLLRRETEALFLIGIRLNRSRMRAALESLLPFGYRRNRRLLTFATLRQTGLSVASLPLAPAAERRYVMRMQPSCARQVRTQCLCG
jgi:hypothetical protein